MDHTTYHGRRAAPYVVWLNHGFTSHADTGPAASRSPFADKGVSRCSSVGKSWGVCSFTWAGATRRAPNLSVPGHVVSESAAVAKPCACLQLKTASTTVVPLSPLGQTLICCPGMFASFCHLKKKETPIYASERYIDSKVTTRG